MRIFFPALVVFVVLASGCISGATVQKPVPETIQSASPQPPTPESASPQLPVAGAVNLSCTPDDLQNCGGYCVQQCPAYCQAVRQSAGGLRQTVCPESRCACVCECLNGGTFLVP